MLIVTVLCALVFVLYGNRSFKKGLSASQRKALFLLHVVAGIVFVCFALSHLISHIPFAPLPMLASGLLACVLLVSQLVIGVAVKALPAKRGAVKARLMRAHRTIPVALVVVVAAHLVIKTVLWG